MGRESNAYAIDFADENSGTPGNAIAGPTSAVDWTGGKAGRGGGDGDGDDARLGGGGRGHVYDPDPLVFNM